MSAENQKRLHDIADGEIFCPTGLTTTWIKLYEIDGWVTAVTKDLWEYDRFDVNHNLLAGSKILNRLTSELLPVLEVGVGADNMLKFKTDLLAADGTYRGYVMESKISLPTLDMYRYFRSAFDKYMPEDWWWLATPDSEKMSLVTTVCYNGTIYAVRKSQNRGGIRPLCIFNSNISVL